MNIFYDNLPSETLKANYLWNMAVAEPGAISASGFETHLVSCSAPRAIVACLGTNATQKRHCHIAFAPWNDPKSKMKAVTWHILELCGTYSSAHPLALLLEHGPPPGPMGLTQIILVNIQTGNCSCKMDSTLGR